MTSFTVCSEKLEICDIPVEMKFTHWNCDEDGLRLNQPCYGGLEEGPKTLFFFKVDEEQPVYFDWVINRSEFKDFFVTKDVEEGFKHGFKAVAGDYDESIDAFRMLRTTNEHLELLKELLDESSFKNPVEKYLTSILTLTRKKRHEGKKNFFHTINPHSNNSVSKFLKDKNKPIESYKEYITCVDW